MIEALQKIGEDTQIWFSKNLKGDRWIWSICIVMLLWSIVVVYSASVKDAYSQKQGDTESCVIKKPAFCLK
jgi:cell division protein FtsW